MEDTIREYDYFLPESLIAQRPAATRDRDRLMVVNRSTKTIAHHRFCELPSLLREGDVLVVNDTKVIPARLVGRKKTGGKTEFLLIRKVDEKGMKWKCMAKRTSRMREGMIFLFPNGMEGEICSIFPGGEVEVQFSVPLTDECLQRIGELPLPPYISRPNGPSEEDYRRYQTIFAERSGAVAAPTAGLHFTPDLMEALASHGIEKATITLHVGPGTFLPVRATRLSQHTMHAEYYEIPEESATRINRAKREKRRVVAVGTTVVRTLESAVEGGEVVAGGRWTSLFIYPPFQFRIVDAMITNFHLPKSTLLVLVCSFASKELIFKAYEIAKRQRYRFYSYGDAMLIV